MEDRNLFVNKRNNKVRFLRSYDLRYDIGKILACRLGNNISNIGERKSGSVAGGVYGNDTIPVTVGYAPS